LNYEWGHEDILQDGQCEVIEGVGKLFVGWKKDLE